MLEGCFAPSPILLGPLPLPLATYLAHRPHTIPRMLAKLVALGWMPRKGLTLAPAPARSWSVCERFAGPSPWAAGVCPHTRPRWPVP